MSIHAPVGAPVQESERNVPPNPNGRVLVEGGAMPSDRESMFLQMTREFPDSPMGFFSLGRLYLDEKRWAESVTALSQAVTLDPNYSAAWVALGDAQLGLSKRDEAKAAWQRALETPHAKRDLSLQGDLEQRLRDLEDF